MTTINDIPENADRLTWLDGLRLAAGVSMVGLHSTADSSGQPFAQYEAAERIIPMLIRAIIYTARTELFLIISIFLLLMALEKRPKSYGMTMRVQAQRLLLPFVFWTFFYAVYNLIKADAFGYADSWVNTLSSPQEWMGFLLLGSVKYHMHFIPTLFGLLLLYPLFRIAVRYPALGLIVLFCLLVKRDVDGFLYANFWGTEVLPYAVRVIKIATYVGYGLMAGAMLGIWQKTHPHWRAQFLPLLLFCGLILFFVKLIATWKTVETGAWPFNYTAGYWADFLMPVLLFALAMSLSHRKWPPMLSRLAPYSFGIYLCHPIFLDLLEIALIDQPFSPWEQVVLKIGFAVSLTTCFVVLLKKTPVLAWTVGLGPLPTLSRKKIKA